MRYFTSAEVALILSACRFAHYRWYWSVLWRTGARCSEALLLRRFDVHTDHILIPTLKQRKHSPPRRILPVAPDFLSRFLSDSWTWGVGLEDLLFPFTKAASWAELAKTKARVGLPTRDRRGHHAFRHGFAKLCLDQGVDLRDLQRYLGHSSIAVTSRYLSITDDHMTRLHGVNFDASHQLTLIKGR